VGIKVRKRRSRAGLGMSGAEWSGLQLGMLGHRSARGEVRRAEGQEATPTFVTAAILVKLHYTTARPSLRAIQYSTAQHDEKETRLLS
jgi:hypothetical protein